MLKALKSGSVRGYNVVPPVLTTWKMGGARDSDIDDVQVMKDKGLFMEGSKNLRHSAREAMAQWFRNDQTPLTELSEEQLHPPPPEKSDKAKEAKEG
jgi:hypothetical protein